MKLNHPKTTILGIMSIVGALITFVTAWISSGVTPNAEHWSILGGAITVGVGLITAADSKKPE